jgi:hypothetical protein
MARLFIYAAAIRLGVLAAPCAATAAEHTPTAVERASLLTPVHRLVQAINQASQTLPQGIFTPDANVIDDFAPYRWAGKTTAATWYTDLIGMAPRDHAAFLAMTPSLSVGVPRFARITDGSAYMVLPAIFVFSLGPKKRIRQTADWIFTETLNDGAWLIAGHAYGINSETPAGR